ncbi:MAG: hypothetical protein ACOZBH_02355 [Patescibacteria group bacterium]
MVILFNQSVFAMQSSNYIINWDSINAGGNDNSQSANYKVRDTLGQLGPGKSDSASYTLHAGYRVPFDEPQILSFSVNAQNDNTEVAYSAFSSASFTATVADASGYAAGDYIAVVENVGPNQMVASGRIIDVSGTVLTVDKWSGDQGSMNGSPSGGDDFVYKLNTRYISLDKLTSAAVSTGVAMAEVTTNAVNGYTVYIKENYNLRLNGGPRDIDDVLDSAVTAGSEEYGIETTGDHAQGANDFAITGVEQAVSSHTGQAALERVNIIYKASISATQTAGGEYSHTTSYYAIANF